MKQIVIDTEETPLPKQVYDLLVVYKFSPGDQVKIISELHKPDSWVMWIGMVLLYSLRKFEMPSDTKGFGDRVLEDLFGRYSDPEALEKELKDEYNVTLTVEHRPTTDLDRKFWNDVGAKAMAKGYSENEPDISGITLLEPNPEYSRWKRGK